MKNPIEITVKLKCLPGDKCVALNYNRRPHDWECGTVRSVKTKIRQGQTYHNYYEVELDRKSKGKSRMFPDGGAPLLITVGDEAIDKTI